MACRVVDELGPEGIPIFKMRDGELGEILAWNDDPDGPYRGKVVQRYVDAIVILGEHSAKAFSTLLREPKEGYRVRILKPRDTIQIMRPDCERSDGDA
ncbi:hypothetical protein LCGC14_0839680 [marine sediment metagenome]|uniref:Uncharacterized protein n=1 Tax=marine sediment metagenome TaxID=412755 RepID=A0A0F9PDL5_9ZZZZ